MRGCRPSAPAPSTAQSVTNGMWVERSSTAVLGKRALAAVRAGARTVPAHPSVQSVGWVYPKPKQFGQRARQRGRCRLAPRPTVVPWCHLAFATAPAA